jgi:hypothetical protein
VGNFRLWAYGHVNSTLAAESQLLLQPPHEPHTPQLQLSGRRPFNSQYSPHRLGADGGGGGKFGGGGNDGGSDGIGGEGGDEGGAMPWRKQRGTGSSKPG